MQLRHTADHTAIHGDRYEYRSGVRPYMVGHLRDRARAAAALVDFEPGDLVVDIGSNDGTLLRNFAPGRPTLVGIAPPHRREVARALPAARRPVLPWIYRAGFEERETSFREGGGKMIFPLPTLDII